MGRSVRRTYLKLSFADEERIFDRVCDDGFVVLSKHLQTPDIAAAVWDHLPTHHVAGDWEDYDCAILPRLLVSKVRPTYLGIESWLEAGRTGEPRGIRPPSPYLLSQRDAPIMSWNRSRPKRPGGELSVERRLDYGVWLETVLGEYERISSWIKRWARKERLSKLPPPVYRYASE
ncbi:MAG: hypothetical protein E6I37_01710 [Chloroflexi bacterium]|nr:MAG: hypothetical protein E6I37_01710 [Chloroflexota bacterium]